MNLSAQTLSLPGGMAARQAARFLALLLPQLVVSTVALIAYRRFFFLPFDVFWMHLPLIALVQSTFFLGCGWLASRRIGQSPMAPRVYAFLLTLKGAAINGLYVLSAASNAFWGDNLSMNDLGAARQHYLGLEVAFGRIVPIGASALLVAIIVGALCLQKIARPLYRMLQWGTVGPGGRSSAASGAFRPAIAATLGSAVLALAGVWMQLFPHEQLRRDPVFSFWGRVDASFAPRTDLLADTKARRDYPVVPQFDRKNVFIFIVDCLRADHLSLSGYERDTTPFLRALQREGRLSAVESAFSVGNDSPQGIFAVLTSRYPDKVRPSSFNVYEALKRQGYRTHAIVSGDHTHFASIRQLYGRNFDVFVDGTTDQRFTVNDDAMILDTLANLPAAGDTPVFMLFHLMTVHAVGVRDPAFRRWSPSHYDPDRASRLPLLNPEFARNTYDNRVLQVDDTLRRIWATLASKGYLRNYTAAITGDHGEALGERGFYGHALTLYAEDTEVPILFVDSAPDSAPLAPLGSQVDIAPTLLAKLGLPVPESWDGVPLVGGPGRNTAYLVSRRTGEWRAVVHREPDALYKYLFFGPLNGQWREALFDLRADPDERQDLSSAPPGNSLNTLRRLAASHFRVPIPNDAPRTRP